jgi:hypothetical protein
VVKTVINGEASKNCRELADFLRNYMDSRIKNNGIS